MKKLVRHLYNLDLIVITIIMMEIFKKERSDEVWAERTSRVWNKYD